jgi:feruloyl esterase
MRLSSSELDDFYRFFRISGMGHCSGGVGAWEFGQTLAGAGGGSGAGIDDPLKELELDPERNVLMAMVRWVEEGVAPETFLGTKFVNDVSLGRTKGNIALERRHCRYPSRNNYKGSGDPTQPDSWECK